MKKNYGLFILLILGLLLIDLFIVRGPGWVIHHIGSRRAVINFLVSGFCLTALLYSFSGIQSRLWRGMLGLFFFAISFVQAHHLTFFETFATSFSIRFVINDTKESLGLLRDLEFLDPQYLGMLLIVPLVFFGLKIDLKLGKIKRGIGLVIAASLFTIALLHVRTLPTAQYSVVAWLKVVTEAAFERVVEPVRQPKAMVPKLPKRSDLPNLVIVIGETAAASHMQIFGYGRNTTPKLAELVEQGDLLAYQNATSAGTRTLASVPYTLTGLEGPDEVGRFFSAPTLFNYAKAAGYQTAFISSQDTSWRSLDDLLVDEDVDYFRDGTVYNSNLSVSRGADDLLVLRTGIEPFLERAAKKERPFLLVIQLIGSHYPYGQKTPEAAKVFLPEKETGGLNAYDNTIIYLDTFLASLYTKLHALDEKAWLFYSSDNGIGGIGKAPRAPFEAIHNIIKNPMMVFPPENEFDQLAVNATRPVSVLDIFMTALRLIEIEPVVPVDGLDLRRPVPLDRVRITTTQVATFDPDPFAYVIWPDFTIAKLDLKAKTATFVNDEVKTFDELDEGLRTRINRYLCAEDGCE